MDVIYIEEYGQGRKTYNSGVCVKGSTSNEFEVDYYEKLEEVIEMQYHKVLLFQCVPFIFSVFLLFL
jgi:hypothetical protein